MWNSQYQLHQDNLKNSQDTQNNNRSSEPDNSTTIINEISSLTIILDNQDSVGQTKRLKVKQ